MRFSSGSFNSLECYGDTFWLLDASGKPHEFRTSGIHQLVHLSSQVTPIRLKGTDDVTRRFTAKGDSNFLILDKNCSDNKGTFSIYDQTGMIRTFFTVKVDGTYVLYMEH